MYLPPIAAGGSANPTASKSGDFQFGFLLTLVQWSFKKQTAESKTKWPYWITEWWKQEKAIADLQKSIKNGGVIALGSESRGVE